MATAEFFKKFIQNFVLKIAGFIYFISSSSKNLSIVFTWSYSYCLFHHTVYTVCWVVPRYIEFFYASIINAYLIFTQSVKFPSKVAPIKQFLLFDVVDLFCSPNSGGGGIEGPVATQLITPPEQECNSRNSYITI